MRFRGGSFGLIALLIVTGIVLVLVAKGWQRIAPSAVGVTNPTSAAADRADSTEDDPMPSLERTRNRTNAHSDEVQEALSATE